MSGCIGRSYRLNDRQRGDQALEANSNEATLVQAPPGSEEIEKHPNKAKAPTGAKAENKNNENQKN